MLYNIIVPEPFTFFYVMYDHVTMTVTCDGSVICDVILAPNSKSKIKINGKENENENENENKVHYLQF